MKLTNELIAKAKTAKSAEELLELAKSENIELTAEQAEKAYAELHKTGELSDEELENAAGGGCGKYLAFHCPGCDSFISDITCIRHWGGQYWYRCNKCGTEFRFYM